MRKRARRRKRTRDQPGSLPKNKPDEEINLGNFKDKGELESTHGCVLRESLISIVPYLN